MKKLILASFAIALLSCAGEAEQNTQNDIETNNDTTSVDTSTIVDVDETFYFEDYAQFDAKTKLYEKYGEENLEDDESWYAEGTVKVVITRLTDPETGNRIQFSWDEDEETLSFIETWNRTWWEENSQDQIVETKEGIYTGMPLEELVEWNEGEHFEFSGFGWDYAGGVFAEEESRLAASKIKVTLTMKDEGYDNFLHLLGDGSHMSSDEDVQGAPIIVGTITYNL